MLKRLELSYRTAYAQAKETASAQPSAPVLTPGAVAVERRGGGEFAYRYRYDASGKRITEYLGRAGGEVVAAAEAEIREAVLLSRASRDLRRVGFNGVDTATAATVARLANAGLFRGGAVLVGTRAFGACLNELGYSMTGEVLRTEDVDVARPARIEVVAVPEGGMLALLRETGLRFLEVPELRRSAVATSWKVRGEHLKVDLLVPAKGAPYRSTAVPELRPYGTGLPFLDYLVEEPMPSVLLGRDRIVPIVVPAPSRFCVHKLAVYALRRPSESAKRAKDLDQAVLPAEAARPRKRR